MSQSGSESDIWEYKPLRQIKRQTKPSDTNKHGAKRQKCPKKVSSKKKGSVTKEGGSSSLNSESKADTDGESPEVGKANRTRYKSAIKSVNLPGSVSPLMPDVSNGVGALQSKGFCPVCQIPFSVVVVQSAQWHVAECLGNPGETEKECPDGLQCTSSIPAHYKRFSHSLLAHRRAINTSNSSTLDYTPSHLEQKSFLNEATVCSKECSVDSAIGLSSGSSQSASPTLEGKESKSTNGFPNALQLLRSPGPEDIKKKKGWSPSTKGSRAQKSSKEPKITISTPVKAENPVQNGDSSRDLDTLDEYISYSPLSELPADTEEKQSRKRLFHSTVLVERGEADSDCDSLILFNDSQSDDILADVLDHYEKSTSQDSPAFEDSVYTSNQSIKSTKCSVKGSSTAGGVDEPRSSTLRISEVHHLAKVENNPHLPSPQRLVLERLRESISHPAQFTSFNSCTDSNSDSVNQKTFTQASKNIPPDMNQKKDKTKTNTTCLKQTDIGVFFGLKPLKQKTEDVVKAEERPHVRSESALQKAKRQNRQQWKSTAGSEVALTTADMKEGAARPTQPEENKAVRQWGRKRWNRGRATEESKQCPFYKKIPGTSFVVDAFQYGTIKGITAYFLTHFHSDHYGGLNKNSTRPVYCNKITGNLVMRKLKVHEQYVHILPMNKECIVDGVKVTLLDANHCPGSAMLRLLLPDGQTVLHTGDFRADPSMELYPELQDIRIQTLYLDTTYCSPEYTFPTQQEVMSFAANTAFEMVTLNPRTLVVCGTYSVGKEKVFLAISQVLGSKVYMSREKYQTMCCLETEQICQYTTNIKAAQVHVLPMMQLNFKNLKTYLQRFSATYDQLVAFKPTGWTFTQSVGVESIHPEIKDNISIYGIPYSEHSSFLELKRFVQWLQPLKIIPTVNVGSSASRKAMNNYFREWQTEVKSVKAVPWSNRS